VIGSGTVTATIVTSSGKSAANRSPSEKWLHPGEVVVAGLVIWMLPCLTRRRRRFLWIMMLIVGLQVVVQGCGGSSAGSSGGGGGSTGTPAGTYTVTITGTTSASNTNLTHSVLVKLTVN